MIDIQPPEHGIHGARDFFIHLFTITVGLLIALGLEGAVAAIDHRHLRNEAEANLRQEIHDNQNLVDHIDARRPEETQQLMKVVDLMDLAAEHKLNPTNTLSVDFGEEDLSEANWKTAATTGAVGYMDYSTVARFAAVYEAQTLYMKLERQIIDSYVEVDSCFGYKFDPKNVPPQTVAVARNAALRTIAEINALHEVGTSLKALYTEALRSGK